MNRYLLLTSALLLAPVAAFAVDGVVLINQTTVTAAGGFPYKITQPGSYRLSGNLQVSALNTDAIEIQTNNVTLDLNGFSITGPVTCTGSGAGLACSPLSTGKGIFSTGSNSVVRNGAVGGFLSGVDLTGSVPSAQAIVEEILVSNNLSAGIHASDAVVRRNVAVRNGTGIEVTASTVTDNIANRNLNGLSVIAGVFGSNTLVGNGQAIFPGSSISQNNNACNGSAC
jgi:hypothetical protein